MEEEDEQVSTGGGGSKSMTLTMADVVDSVVEDNADDEQDTLRTMDGV